MPEPATLQRARQDKRAGKAPSTQAGEFVREEIHHVREGKHGARSTKQAIAIGLSKARRAVRSPRREHASPTVSTALSRNSYGVEARRPSGCIAEGPGPPGHSGRSTTTGRRTQGSGPKRGTDEGATSQTCCRTKGYPNADHSPHRKAPPSGVMTTIPQPPKPMPDPAPEPPPQPEPIPIPSPDPPPTNPLPTPTA